MRRRRPPPPGFDRLHVFVPAIMSVGLLFWVVTLTRDLFHWRGEQALRRRARAFGKDSAAFVLGELGDTPHRMPGLRLRISYLVTAVVCGGLALYVLVGSGANYLREGGRVKDVAWLLALSLVVTAAFGFVAGVAATVFVSWPRPPAWLRGVLLSTPLSGEGDAGAADQPRWGLSTAATLLPVAAGVFTFVVAEAPAGLERFDRAVAEWIGDQPLGRLDVLDPATAPWAVVLLAVLVGVAGLRCRPFAVALPVTAAAGVLAVNLAGTVTRAADSPLVAVTAFPSFAVVAVVFVAAVVPRGVSLLWRRQVLRAPLHVLAALVAAGSVVGMLHAGRTTATATVGGLLFGLAAALPVEWALWHRRWHSSCRGCPWAPEGAATALLHPVPFHAEHRRLLRLAAHLAALLAVVGLAAMTYLFDVPSDPTGALLGTQIQRPVQLALAGLVSLGALVSWRFEAVGTVMIAVAAAGLGIYAGLEYRPELALLLTGALLVPSVLLWLSWQHRRRRGELIALALVTLALLGATWFGADRVYGQLWGPTHPDSTAPDVRVDRVRWMWSGGLHSRGAVVVAGVTSPGAEVVAVFRPEGGGTEVTTPVDVADADGVARVGSDRLVPGTSYDYQLVVDGQADTGRGRGSLRTPQEGATSFRVAFAACARTGSNAAVFDAIRTTDPLVYLSLGDIHYSNLESTDVADFRAAFERFLEQPGQAALYRQVPIGYVWDDHDYGPNDADGSSPSRRPARLAYRQVVPHHPLPGPGDEPIYQAFTIGRVRFVMTDNRSERSPTSMLGPTQERWLVDELTTSSRTHALVVWANPVPWVGAADPTSDSWAGYAEERGRIADALATAGVHNMVMLSGDAHMVALDDGTNTDYSASRSGGFPLMHAAPLDRPGGVKGGPYTSGPFAGSGQFGTLDVHDDGTQVSVVLTGWDWEGTRLVSQTFEPPFTPER